MSKQVMQKALEALTLTRSQLDVLWVSHHANRTDAALASADAAIAELRAAIAKPVEPVAWTVTEMDSVITNNDKQTNAVQFSQRYLDMHDIPLYTAPPDTEAMRRDAERYQHLMQTTYTHIAHMLGVKFGDYTPDHDIIRRIGLNIDAEMAGKGGGE